MTQVQAFMTELAKMAEGKGYVVMSDDMAFAMETAALKLAKPVKQTKTPVNKNAAQHIAFLLRQQAVERAYASVGQA